MAKATFEGDVFDAIYIGGGDLQNPTAKTDNDSGAFFMVKDRVFSGVAPASTPVVYATSTCAPATGRYVILLT